MALTVRQVEFASFVPYGDNRFSADASDLGFPPGFFPERLQVGTSDPKAFSSWYTKSRRFCMLDEADRVSVDKDGAVYVSRFRGVRSFYVAND